MLSKITIRRALSPALLVLVLGCFFLPFATVSCGAEHVSFTGAELAAGAVPDSGPDSIGDEVEAGGQFFALLALGSVLAAAVLAALRSPSGPAFLLSELAFLALCWLYVQAALSLADEVDLQVGYLLALALLLASMCLHAPALRGRGLWAAVAAGVPGMLHPVVLLVAVIVFGLIYLVVAGRRAGASSQEVLSPPTVQTTGKNDSSIEGSPTLLLRE